MDVKATVTIDGRNELETGSVESLIVLCQKGNNTGQAMVYGTEQELVHNVLHAINGNEDFGRIFAAAAAYVLVADEEDMTPNFDKVKKQIMGAVIDNAFSSGELFNIISGKAKGGASE